MSSCANGPRISCGDYPLARYPTAEDAEPQDHAGYANQGTGTRQPRAHKASERQSKHCAYGDEHQKAELH